MDSNLVARVNVDAYCPKIRKKRQNVWEMEITTKKQKTIITLIRCDTT